MPRFAGQRPTRETMQEQKRWLSVEEIAAHLGVNRDTIYKWLTSGFDRGRQVRTRIRNDRRTHKRERCRPEGMKDAAYIR